MTENLSATLRPAILDRAKSFGGTTYGILLAVQSVAESMAENSLREVKVTFHTGGELITLEAKR